MEKLNQGQVSRLLKQISHITVVKDDIPELMRWGQPVEKYIRYKVVDCSGQTVRLAIPPSPASVSRIDFYRPSTFVDRRGQVIEIRWNRGKDRKINRYYYEKKEA